MRAGAHVGFLRFLFGGLWLVAVLGLRAAAAPKPLPPSAKVLQAIGTVDPLRVKRGRDSEIHIACLEGDVDAQFIIKRPPASGRLLADPKKINLSTASVTYRPPEDPAIRSDVFEFAVKNRAGVSFPATVRLEIMDPPVLLGLPRETLVTEPVWAGQPFELEIPVTNDSGLDVRVRPEARGPFRLEGVDAEGHVVVPSRGKAVLRVVLNTGQSGVHRGQLVFPGRSEVPASFQVLALAPVALQRGTEEWSGAAKEAVLGFPAEGFQLINRAPFPVRVRMRSTPNLVHPPEVVLDAQKTVPLELSHDANSDFREGVLEVEAEGALFRVRWTYRRPPPVSTVMPFPVAPPVPLVVVQTPAAGEPLPVGVEPVPSVRPSPMVRVSPRPAAVSGGSPRNPEADRIARAVAGIKAAESQDRLQRGFHEAMEVFGAMPSLGIRTVAAGAHHVVLEWENPQRRDPSEFQLEIRRERMEDRVIPPGAPGNEQGTDSLTVTGMLVEWVPVRPEYVRLVLGGSRIAARVDALPAGLRHSFRVFVRNPGNQLDFVHAIEADTKLERPWYAVGNVPLALALVAALGLLVWQRVRARH
jgi:hypothetical protein